MTSAHTDIAAIDTTAKHWAAHWAAGYETAVRYQNISCVDLDFYGLVRELIPLLKKHRENSVPRRAEKYYVPKLRLVSAQLHILALGARACARRLVTQPFAAAATTSVLFMNLQPDKYASLFAEAARHPGRAIALANSRRLARRYPALLPGSSTFDPFSRAGDVSEALAFVKQLLKTWPQMVTHWQRSGFFMHHGVDFAPIVAPVILKRIARYFGAYILAIAAAQRLCLSRPFRSMVLWTDELWFEKVCIEVGKQHAIRSVVVQHGISGNLTNNRAIYASCFAVWGHISQSDYLRMGIPEKQLVVTGSLVHDHLSPDKYADEASQWRTGRGIAPQQRVILCPMLPLPQHRSFSAAIPDNEGAVLFASIASLAAQHPEIIFLIKCRSKAEETYYRKRPHTGTNMLFIHTLHNRPLFALCDMLISYHSTMVVEGLLFNKISLIAHFTAETPPIPYADYGAALMCHNPEELATLFAKIIVEPEIKETCLKNGKLFLNDYFVQEPPSAAQRVWELL